MGLIIPVWSSNLLSSSKIHIFPKRKCIKMKLYGTHMHAHTDIQYIPSGRRPGNCWLVLSWLCKTALALTMLEIVRGGGGGGGVTCAGAENDMQEMHASTLAAPTTNWRESLVNFYSHSFCYLKSKLQSAEGRQPHWRRACRWGECQKEHHSVHQSQNRLWNVKCAEEFSH